MHATHIAAPPLPSTEGDSLGTERAFEKHARSVARAAIELRNGVVRSATVHVAEEVPVALVYNAHPHVVMMASPCDLHDFAIGFSLTEGIVNHADDVKDFFTYEVADGIELHIEISAEQLAPLQSKQKNLPGRSSCGLCGTQMLADAVRQLPPLQEHTRLSSQSILRAASELSMRQPLHQQTGGTHAAAWCNPAGEVIAVREDVGRHNALDKLIGYLARCASLGTPGFVLMSSRASYELVQKIVTVGIETLATVSAPTALAIELAERSNATLIGFTREARMTVYTGAQRVITG